MKKRDKNEENELSGRFSISIGLVVIGLISKATDIVFQTDIGIFAPMVKSYVGIFLIANTCFFDGIGYVQIW